MRTFLSVIIAISCIMVIVSVVLQESKQAGLGTLDGSVESANWGSHSGTSRKQMLEKTTLIASIVMMISIIAVAAI